MAEEKKKIDLKARLKKDATPAPPSSSGGVPSPGSSSPIAGMSGPGIPVPPGAAMGGRDASNPLAIAAGMAREAHPQAHQRIEVDQTEIRSASGTARRTGLVIGLFIALLACGAGFMAGNAQEVSNGRKKAQADARELKTNVDTAKAKLET